MSALDCCEWVIALGIHEAESPVPLWLKSSFDTEGHIVSVAEIKLLDPLDCSLFSLAFRYLEPIGESWQHAFGKDVMTPVTGKA